MAGRIKAANSSRRDSRRTAFVVFSQAMSATSLASFADLHGLEVIAGDGHMPSTPGGTIYSFGIRDIGFFEGTTQQKLDFVQQRYEFLSNSDDSLRNQEDSNRNSTVATESAAAADADLWYISVEVISSYYILNQLQSNPSIDTVILKADWAEDYDKLLANFTPLDRNVANYLGHYPSQSPPVSGSGFSTLGEPTVAPQSPLSFNSSVVLCGPSSPFDNRCPMNHMYAPSRDLQMGGKATAYGIHRNYIVTIQNQPTFLSALTTGDTLRWGDTQTTFFTNSSDPRPFGTLAFDGSLDPKCDLDYDLFDTSFDCGSGGVQNNGIFVVSAGYEAENKVEDTECSFLFGRTGTAQDMFAGCFFPFMYRTSFPGSSAPYLDTTFGDDSDELNATVGVRFADRLQAGVDYENTVYSRALGVQHSMVGTDDMEQGAQISAPAGCGVFSSPFCMFNLEQYSLNQYEWIPIPF